jgi:hypothetical protein
LLPFIGPEVEFESGADVAMMRMTTLDGREVVLPFAKETLRAIGLALADALKTAFADEHAPTSLSDVVFVDRPGGQ